MNKTKTTPFISITNGRILARNSVWNLLGGGAPLLAALFAVPLLIKALGTDRFGALTLVWMVVGYFSLFDLGLGRALTKLVAEKLGAGEEDEVPVLVWTALALMAVLGIVGVAVVVPLSPWLVYKVLKFPNVLKAEMLKVFYLLALSIPIVISTTGLRGVLEAYQRFDLTNAIRIPAGLFNFLGPLAVLLFSKSFISVVGVLVLGRLFVWVVHFLLCMRLVPSIRKNITIHRAMIRPLVSFGSWITVSNSISPLMVYFDRFLIGAMISMTAVAYYATPYEIITKLWLFPIALVGVLFPAFSTTLRGSRDRAVHLFGRGMKYIFLILFPLILIIVTLAHEGLKFWLGSDFAQHSAFVAQWLAIGMLVNSIARVPYALIQAAGRPDITAKLHLIELPFYFLSLWCLINIYGIKGAAIAWVLRVTVDMIILLAITRRILPATAKAIWQMALVSGVALLCFAPAMLTVGIIMKVLFVAAVMIIFVLAAWFLVLTTEERLFVRNSIKLIPLIN